MKEFTISENDAGQKAIKFIGKAVPRLPLSLTHKYLRLKRIKLNGKKCPPDAVLNPGDKIQMYINDEFFDEDPKTEFTAAPPCVNVIYEDSHVLLVDKPAGLVVHSDSENSTDTLINRITHYLYNKGEYNPELENSFAPALCNRIDRNTCGIVIAAKTAEALRVLNEKIKAREIKKTYLCAVFGTPSPKQGRLEHYLKKDSDKNLVTLSKHPIPDSKTAISEYKVVKSDGEVSILEVNLITGRTHQIRAQLAYIGHPLVGDGKYGTLREVKGKRYRKQALCAHKIKFDFSGEPNALSYLDKKEFVTPIPWFYSLV